MHDYLMIERPLFVSFCFSVFADYLIVFSNPILAILFAGLCAKTKGAGAILAKVYNTSPSISIS